MCEEIGHQFLVRGKLGQGGFGQVFLVAERRTGRPFAVKVAPNENKAEREGAILLALNHPCVIRTFGYGTTPQKLILVMEYMQGGDLTRFVKEKSRLTSSQTKLIFYQLTLAVQYLHARGIVHRDLKPANVLLATPQPCSLIKVTDFGVAKNESLHGILKTGLGTQNYIAPEILTQKKYTNKVDVYSMGVILHLSLTGHFPSKTGQKLFPQDVSERARRLVMAMLTTDPQNRRDIGQVLGSQWLQDDPMKATANSLMQKATTHGPVERLTIMQTVMVPQVAHKFYIIKK